jgi:hypothetical protein
MRYLRNMMPNKEHIELLDKMLLFWMDKTRQWSPTTTLFAKENEISIELAELVYVMFCEIGNEEEILVAIQSGYGEYRIGRINDIQAKYFINKGGFKEYYKRLLKSEQSLSNVVTINNTGNIENLSQSINDNSTNTVVDQNVIKTKNELSKKSFWLERLYWIAGVILATIAVYELWLHYIKK